MKKFNNLLLIGICTVGFTFLFYQKPAGLNLFLFEVFLIVILLVSKKLELKRFTNIMVFLGFCLTSIFTVVVHSALAYWIHILMLVVFAGVSCFPEVRSLMNAAAQGIIHSVQAQAQFLNTLFDIIFSNRRSGVLIKRGLIFVIPLVIVLLFVVIYSLSNPVFNNMLNYISSGLEIWITWLINHLDIQLLLTVILGLLFSNYLLFKTSHHPLMQYDQQAVELFERIRGKKSRIFKTTSLLNEYRAAIFLLVILNVLILLINVIDIYWVWFHFEWKGQYLKQFVHEGTWLLILSILISITIVLYFFRGNLNFYQKNNLLKYLSYAWLGQNAILAVSVAIRNFWYIQYFALAYKRIGVFLFLVMTLYGLYTVFVKVRSRKSAFYLFRTNTAFLLTLLVLSSAVNWDKVIARYNFNHYETAFVHLDYLVKLSDASLPILDKSPAFLDKIDVLQKKSFPFEMTFMSREIYYTTIQNRKQEFLRGWESKSIWSWNLPDYLAYKDLSLAASP